MYYSIVIVIVLRFAADKSQDTTWDGVVLAHAMIWTAIELNYCLISATIPVLGPFISNLSTSFGVTLVLMRSINS